MTNGTAVIDMQHHYIPSEALQFVGKTAEYDYSVSLRRFRKAYDTMVDITKSLAYMDGAGIDMAILSTAPSHPMASTSAGCATVVTQRSKAISKKIQRDDPCLPIRRREEQG